MGDCLTETVHLSIHNISLIRKLFYNLILIAALGQISKCFVHYIIAPDKAAYCVFTQFRERENAIKFISVRTKTQ